MITDRALVGYIRRVKGFDMSDLHAGTDRERLAMLSLFHGIDVESFREEMSSIVEVGVRLGANAVKKGGIKFVLRRRKVVTCY